MKNQNEAVYIKLMQYTPHYHEKENKTKKKHYKNEANTQDLS